MALWLLKGDRLPDRVAWLVHHGFRAVALLQTVMDADPGERAEAAAVIRQAGLRLTYHGNFHGHQHSTDELNTDFARRMCDDILWWHAHTQGVWSCGSDALHTPDFNPDLNRQWMRLAADRLQPAGIRYGLENQYGGAGRFESVQDITSFQRHCGLPDLGLLLDIGHLNIHRHSTGVSVGDYVRQVPVEIFEVHVTENHGRQDEHRALGTGTFDLPDLLRALQQRQYRGPLTVEVCVDILHGRFDADIHNPTETEPLLLTRDALRTACLALTRFE